MRMLNICRCGVQKNAFVTSFTRIIESGNDVRGSKRRPGLRRVSATMNAVTSRMKLIVMNPAYSGR
jgi:hypothetical protein